MSRTLNGEPLPDDCPCVVGSVETVATQGGRRVVSKVEVLRPVADCPQHGHRDDAADNLDALAPATEATIAPSGA